MIESVKRVDIPSGPAVRMEVLVQFKDAEKRDAVMGAASKLATCVTEDGKPTAGIRIQVPPKLLPVFRTLFRYGQNIRSRHGPGTRRHVKFDDALQTLYLNAKLPGDERWSQVSFEMARRGIRTKRESEDVDIERRFDIGGPCFPDERRRAASTGSSTPMQTTSWNNRRTESVNLD